MKKEDIISTERHQRDSILIRYKGVLVQDKEDYVEVCRWANGEGFDFTLEDDQVVPISYEQWSALKKIVKELDKEEKGTKVK